MPKKVTHEEYVESIKKMYGEEYKILSEYKNSRTKVEVLHSKCGRTHMKAPMGLKLGKGCPYCVDHSDRKGKTTKKRTHEDFVNEVLDLVEDEYVVTGEFSGMKNNVEMLHKKCSHTFNPQPYEFLKKGTRCPECSKKNSSLGHEEFIRRVKELTEDRYEVLGEYVNNSTNILMRHKVCGQEFKPRPNGFLAGSNCPYCSGRKSNKETFKRELHDLLGNEYTLVGEYVNKMTKVNLLHESCGETISVEPIHVLKSGRRCPKCVNRENGVKRRKSHKQFSKELNNMYNG